MTETAVNTANRDRAKHRSIVERIVVCGELVLETPASFGNGDADAWTDMPLLADELDGSPLLPGTSIAGALRNYLRERECGYEKEAKEFEKEEAEKEQKDKLTALEKLLFGVRSGSDDGVQSPLIVHDALGQASDYELRDGVKIDAATRTAEDKKKFDMQLLAAGTSFALRFDLLISQDADRDNLVQALATALAGLADGRIALGARKRRGFGRCRVHEWRVRRYDMQRPDKFLAWLAEGRDTETDRWAEPVAENRGADIAALLEQTEFGDNRDLFTLEAKFALNGSLMVRSGFGESDQGADMVHLHSKRVNQRGQVKATRRPILPGTSWAGALRARAGKIARTLAQDEAKVKSIVERLFGPEMGDTDKRNKNFQAHASRLVIADTEITDGVSLNQTRIKIDRFTGGAFESALFSEEPVFGKPETCLKLDLQLRFPADYGDKRQAEIGLVLLLLKDLWTGDLALGGESSIGRGRLRGVKATINDKSNTWILEQANEGLTHTGDLKTLEDCVTALGKELQ